MQEYLFRSLFFILSIVILSSGCQEGAPIEVLTKIDPTITSNIIRYDQKLSSISSDQFAIQLQSLEDAHPAFTSLFINQILALPDNADIVKEEIIRMVSDSGYIKLNNDVNKIYDDFNPFKPEIDQALENYMQIFDVRQVPTVYTFISGFVYQCFVFDDIKQEGIGIGLDMFLGPDFPYDKIDPTNPSFSSYLTKAYNKNYISKKVAEVLVEDKLTPPLQSDFLSLMIWGGKKLYIMDQILSFKPDHMVIEYSPDQYSWCQNNEVQMWDLFFEKNLFYETDLRKFNKLIGPAPTSPGMPPESPGRTANYMGWQIVKSYMKRYPETSIQQLINLNDPQQILDDSKFKPRK